MAHNYQGFSGLKQVTGVKALTAATPTAFATLEVPQTANVNYASGYIEYSVHATDGTDIQVVNGRLAFAVVNKAGTLTSQLSDNLIGSSALSGGTLGPITFSVTAGTNRVTFLCSATSSLTTTTFAIHFKVVSQHHNSVDVL